jgi:hypothetical protein
MMTHRRDWNAVLLGILDELGAAEEIPLSPWCNNFDVRLQTVVRYLKAHLQSSKSRIDTIARANTRMKLYAEDTAR